MKHVTCDMCGSTAQGSMLNVVIVWKSYDLCLACRDKILKPLEGNGEGFMSNRNIQLPPNTDDRKIC